MSVHRRTAAIVIARRLRNYEVGDKVRVLRGDHGGKVCTIRENGTDHVALVEAHKREIMSKGNVEPVDGFTNLEMENAERESRRGA